MLRMAWALRPRWSLWSRHPLPGALWCRSSERPSLEGCFVAFEPCLLLFHECMRFGVYVVEDHRALRAGDSQGPGADVGGEIGRLLVDRVEELLLHSAALQVGAEAHDRVARHPVGELFGVAVLGGVVGRRVRADPIRERLYERGA